MARSVLTTVAQSLIEVWLSTLDAAVGACFRCHLRAATETAPKGLSYGQVASSIRQWHKWIDFYDEMGTNPFLEAFTDKVPILQVFTH